MAALDELERARDIWLAYEEEFADRRKREKHDGLRRPPSGDEWHRNVWGGNGVARCDSPREHPSAPLDEVMRRLVTALAGAPGAHCPVCGTSAIVWRQVLKNAPWAGPVCTGCGILLPRPVLTDDAVAAAQQAARHTVLASVA
nr:hypothetical protein [Streptomyces tsukubensis NRRL18488]